MNRALRGLAGAGCGLVVLGLAGACGGAAAGAAHAAGQGVIHVVHVAGGRVSTNQSDNWSGYNIGAAYPGEPAGVTFTSISGEWTVPAATQRKHGQAEYSASWVGIGGGCVTDNCQVTDNTLIQAGTEQDVAKAGKASYGAWWEIIPEPQTKVSLPVRPGNKIKVSIAQASTPGDWSIVIDNLTTGRRFATTTPYASSMDTAEWIEETPLVIGTGGTGVAAMPSLGTVHFTRASLNQASPAFQTVDEIQLVTNGGTVIATPSGPGPALASFNDCIWKTTCAAP
jgi:Peptidase A4 family